MGRRKLWEGFAPVLGQQPFPELLGDPLPLRLTAPVAFPPDMTTDIQTCYRHPDRRAGVTCQRCDRPICPSCMMQASVGFQCPECAKTGKQKVFTARTLPTLNKPIVTQALIGINAAVFVIGLTQSTRDVAGGITGWAEDYGLLGSIVFRGTTVPGLGVAEGEWWRLITGGFLHAGLIHLGMNMLALWFLGSQLEPAIGRLQFAVVYASSLLTGSLGVMILSPHDLTVGASGAIFGLFGLALAGQLSRGINIWDSGLGGILMINLIITFGIPSISIGGHLGGLAGGFICGEILYELTPRLKNKAVPVALCAALGLACMAAAVVVAGNAA